MSTGAVTLDALQPQGDTPVFQHNLLHWDGEAAYEVWDGTALPTAYCAYILNPFDGPSVTRVSPWVHLV